MADQPAWVPAFEDIMAAAALVLEESRHAEVTAEIYEEGAHSPALPHWRQWASEARERARLLNRAAAILDWVGRRTDRLHLLTNPKARHG